MPDKPLDTALDILATAATPAALVRGHSALKQVVSLARQRANAKLGTLAKTYIAAMEIWDAQKAEGLSFEERAATLRASVEAAWPKGRMEPWHTRCASCNDYGLEMLTCPGDETCGATSHGHVFPHAPHEYGRPCWCQRGARFREKPKAEGDDFKAAGKSKPRGFTRYGS
jgi:hypothetical protein